MFSKLYGFYHDFNTESLIAARFQELKDSGISLEMEAIPASDQLAALWGVNVFPTFILSKYNARGPILQGAFPGHDMLAWLNKYKIIGNNE
jgi:protein-disulfide isomerase-like protein with CxxC motif